ncbi:hypothetical protein UFOVP1247_228 [uncultured Caudovirales phage]|jgi:hypothetical protein|uniref:Uncharacterized protein n=1 Tax=uncultured Caudovirales phage TaxID=2100421 RepID=A0A6J5RHW2_9CAUD|nr:hypothetical protein UFOVP970_268 [uncultured Caudovirales phage]CAB4193857.1 hypothetical protein UFOVP1247_228 [uncultured Caudovirales phage]
MFKKLKYPKLSHREKSIIQECCSQVLASIEKQNSKEEVDPFVKQVMEDIPAIIKKLELFT